MESVCLGICLLGIAKRLLLVKNNVSVKTLSLFSCFLFVCGLPAAARATAVEVTGKSTRNGVGIRGPCSEANNCVTIIFVFNPLEPKILGQVSRQGCFIGCSCRETNLKKAICRLVVVYRWIRPWEGAFTRMVVCHRVPCLSACFSAIAYSADSFVSLPSRTVPDSFSLFFQTPIFAITGVK